MPKVTNSQNSFNLGEISPRAFGRYEQGKPIYSQGAARLENFLNQKTGGAMYWPGTQYIASVKDSTKKVRLAQFVYSTSQSYILEIGDLYFRFFANKGQVVSAGNPVEIVTPFAVADIFSLQFANKADVMYIVGTTSSGIGYHPQKLVRTSSTTFTITPVSFIRGPFRDSNITATTLTASGATGAGITVTASAATFLAGHVGSLWRIKNAVVKITAFSSTTSVTADVQAEPDGTAGNIGSTSAQTDWAEGAFSDVQGWPSAISFHEQRLVYGGAIGQPAKFYASVIGGYDNFSVGSKADSDAYAYEIASDLVADIHWLSSNTSLQIGTSAGTFSATGSAGGVGITPTSIAVSQDTDYSVLPIAPSKLSNYLYYVAGNGFTLRQLVFDLGLNKQKADDMMILADHIVRDGSGAVQIARQQSPNDRLWVVRSDGQLAVFTRDAEQQVLAWCRRTAGLTAKGAGIFESVAIIVQDNADDQIWVVVQRNINGTVKRFVELFTDELFTNYYDPVRTDASLTYDTPKTISGATKASPVVITATAHGFSNLDQVKIDNVVGMTDLNTNIYYVAGVTTDTFQLKDVNGNAINGTSFGAYISGGQVRKMVTAFSGLTHLIGETVSVSADGGLPAGQQTFTVDGTGAIALPFPAAVVHVGLPYTGYLQLLPLGDGSQTGTGQTKLRKVFLSTLRVWKSLGGQIGFVDSSGALIGNLMPLILPTQTPQLPAGHAPSPFTGDIEQIPPADFSRYVSMVLEQTVPLPFYLLSAILQSEVNEK